MEEYRLCNSDYRFMTLVWEHGPIGSGELVRLCAEYLGWKKSTTYTEIKRLSQKGVLKNENAVVADFYRSTASGYDVRCQLKEKEISMIDLTIHVRTKAQAEAVCRNWKEQNMDIYTYLMDMLIQ